MIDRGSSSAPSDALVFFGATGDLAFKKIFSPRGGWQNPAGGKVR